MGAVGCACLWYGPLDRESHIIILAGVGIEDFGLTVCAAVAARFGIGSDFWLNLLLTLCGYIPGKSDLSWNYCRLSGYLVYCADIRLSGSRAWP